ncbi:UNVERIFIED_CONTAM: hypothetical protein PYX00_007245 [Menopon gallinae]|uniref:Uncharacterized protein n=1 Tax=Menopon gallinae TaxID=328185 RepID=A0AAW2HI06_9NEOP
MDTGKVKREPNPKEKTNILSDIFFLWTGKIFRRGLKDPPMSSSELCMPLTEDTSDALGNALEEKWVEELENAKKRGRKPKLLYAVVKAFGWGYAKLALIHAANEIFRLAQPLLLGRLLLYFTGTSMMTKDDGLMYAGGMILLCFVGTILQNHYGMHGFHYGMKVRVACCSLIYRKTLRLSKTALGETAAGQAVNLLSNDVSRFDLVTFFLHYLWSAPIGALLILYYMWLEAGIAGIVGVLAVLVVVPLQSYTGKMASRFRLQTAYKTDERVRLMDEIICGIQVIKMYAWEKPFARLISVARAKELQILKKSSYVRGLYMTFNLFTTRFAVFSTMITLSLFGESLSADKIFVYSSYLSMMAFTMSGMYTRGFAEAAESLVALKRLTKYMMYEENTDKSDVAKQYKIRKDSGQESENFGEISLKEAKAQWHTSQQDATLQNISLEIKNGSLTAVVGPVGCGKSSLLHALLGELPFKEGKVSITGRISYASQEPWVFAASVRQNIIFGLPFNRARYAEVVRVCALNDDFAQWPDGDRTIIGERGMSLSGGQRARINLARAIYKEADIYLLDDPLSAVDTNVGKHLFDECICYFLRNKTRILITHQVQYLEKADLIVLLNNGSVELQGNYEKLANSNLDFAQLFRREPEEVEKIGDVDEEMAQSPTVQKQLSLPPSQSNRNSRAPDAIGESVENLTATPLEEIKVETESAFSRYFLAGANICTLCILIAFFIISQISASLCDFWVSVWTTQDLLQRKHLSNSINFTTQFYNETSENGNETQIKSIDFMSTETCQLIYSGLIISLFLITITRSIIFYNICMKSSQRLHDTMFKAVSETYMSFFNSNPSGRILNRFSKDLGSIDELLPKALLDAGQIIMVIIGVIIVAVIINYVFLLPVLVIAVFGGLARYVFLRTSTNLKKIEGITRSPVFTHLNATLQGLTTIRAYQAEEILKNEFDKHQDLHTAAWHLFISISTAFGFILDFLCFLLIAFVTFLLILVETDLFGGEVGLAITQIMALSGMVQWGMRQSAEVYNQLTSVERVLEYTELKTEDNLESSSWEKEAGKRLEAWPDEGKIEFQNLFLYYKEDEPPAIKDLTLTINSGEKIGIVGRTGAGKSSIISSLFRLAKVDGAIRIDGVDTSCVALQRLRSRISIIPQEPVLFSGTIRRNLDPFQMFTDIKLNQAIEEVELKDALSNGLDTQVLEGGSNFSVGQKQLLCLARAILRSNKILLLDEATASVDPQTDALIQKTIRSKFADCTVCTIAHRINTIMDSDRVLVMDNGRMVEFDTPYNLLQRPAGHFAKLARHAGAACGDQLRRAADV